MTHADQAETQAFDVDAPFIAEDGLEYESLADKICGRPADCWRNRTIQEFRRNGCGEKAVREWIKFHDGDDPTPTIVLVRRAHEAETSVEAIRISAELSSRNSRAFGPAYAIEPHDDFCPF